MSQQEHHMRPVYTLALLACTVRGATGSPPEVPAELHVKPGQVVSITVKTDKKIGIIASFTETDVNAPFFGELVAPAGTRKFMFQVPQTELDADGNTVYKGKSQYNLAWFTEGELSGSNTVLLVDGATDQLKPKPKPPTPKPDDPTVPVDPLKSFRVIFIYESADTLTPAQRAVVYGKGTEDYLNANCTGGKAGWRRRDKDAPGDSDATFSALWSAVQPKVTVTPCVAIERNGKVDILNLDATPTAMVATLDKYKGK